VRTRNQSNETALATLRAHPLVRTVSCSVGVDVRGGSAGDRLGRGRTVSGAGPHAAEAGLARLLRRVRDPARERAALHRGGSQRRGASGHPEPAGRGDALARPERHRAAGPAGAGLAGARRVQTALPGGRGGRRCANGLYVVGPGNAGNHLLAHVSRRIQPEHAGQDPRRQCVGRAAADRRGPERRRARRSRSSRLRISSRRASIRSRPCRGRPGSSAASR
jgi:hypothetical protein